MADWLRSDAVQSAVTTLHPVRRAEVARLLPAAGHSTGSRATTDAWQRHRFFEGLARALLAVRRPLLLVLDNVQWCDQETLAFITFCLGLVGPVTSEHDRLRRARRDVHRDRPAAVIAERPGDQFPRYRASRRRPRQFPGAAVGHVAIHRLDPSHSRHLARAARNPAAATATGTMIQAPRRGLVFLFTSAPHPL